MNSGDIRSMVGRVECDFHIFYNIYLLVGLPMSSGSIRSIQVGVNGSILHINQSLVTFTPPTKDDKRNYADLIVNIFKFKVRGLLPAMNSS